MNALMICFDDLYDSSLWWLIYCSTAAGQVFSSHSYVWTLKYMKIVSHIHNSHKKRYAIIHQNSQV